MPKTNRNKSDKSKFDPDTMCWSCHRKATHMAEDDIMFCEECAKYYSKEFENIKRV